MSYHQGAEGGAIPKERQKDGSSNKDLDETMDPDMKRPGEVPCDICSEVQAVKFCQTCTISYCETHVRKHYTVPKLQRHTLVEVTGDLQERLCQEHHRTLEVFCRTDQMLICLECSVTKHKGHDLIIEEIKQTGRQTFDGEQRQRPESVDVLPPPGKIQVLSVRSDSVSLSWGSPEGLKAPHKFRVTWGCDLGETDSSKVKGGYHLKISSLQPGEKYHFNVATEGEDGSQSRCVSASLSTLVPPRDLKVDNLNDTSFTLRWSKAEGMGKVPTALLHIQLHPRKRPPSQPILTTATKPSQTCNPAPSTLLVL
ncbi:hypothetical protein J4Q44_G00038930 [Coregonus suidteri]|uniref:Uncharacterized protein n=1 Tax=Coregonus suidteri TaxID=861788 RepID=A0AAN8ME78_9TELE